MKNVLNALIDALRTLIHPKMLALILWPMLVAGVAWAGIAVYFWDSWVTGMSALIQSLGLEQWLAEGSLAIVSHYLITVVLILLLLPAIYVTALVITAIFVMPMMVNHVAAKYYPALERKQGGNTVGSIVNSTVAIVVYAVGWVLSLPLWLFSPFALVLPVVLMAYLNQRLFRYDALAEHASAEEYERIIERATPRLYLLGAAVGLLQFVPLLNLFAPVYIGLAFIHLCLAELQQLRQA